MKTDDLGCPGSPEEGAEQIALLNPPDPPTDWTAEGDSNYNESLRLLNLDGWLHDYKQAAPYFAQAIEADRAKQDQAALGWSLYLRAYCAACGDRDCVTPPARLLLEEALTWFQTTNDEDGERRALALLGRREPPRTWFGVVVA